MKISVFGLGYVGAVTAGCLAERGHHVIGVDIHPQKVEDFNRGLAPITEPELDQLLRQAHVQGRLRATASCAEAIADSEVSLICVGTPSQHNGALDLSHAWKVTRQIADALRTRPKPHALIYRSTMLPGSTRQLVSDFLSPWVEEGTVQVLHFPEFLREGTAVADFRDPSLAVLGTREGAPVSTELAALVGNAISVTNWETAELVKYACNAFHATKVTFANEIGRLGKKLGVNTELVMRLLCQDTRLNLSPYYLRPGNPFGGSCLPKDVRALSYYGREHGLSLPLLENLLASNQQHLQALLQKIAEQDHREVIMLGLSFKSGTDDLRGSAMVEVAQNLVSHGYTVRIYDPQLNLARMVGSNRRVIDLKMPLLSSLLKEDLAQALGQKGLILAAQKTVPLEELSRTVTPQHRILDINGWPELRKLPIPYEGLCW